jgi:hypothetical protein
MKKNIFFYFFIYFSYFFNFIYSEILCSQVYGDSLTTENCEFQTPDFDGDRCCLYKANENNVLVTQCISINEDEIENTINQWEGKTNNENGITYDSISIECYVEPEPENINFIKSNYSFLILIIYLLI